MSNWDEMTPRERDALVATEVMGLDVHEAGAVGQDWCHPSEIIHLLYAAHGPLRDTWDRVPRYSTDIAAAWKVVEKMREAGWGFDVGFHATDEVHEWAAIFERTDGRDVSSTVGEAPTAPEAICLAALRANRVWP